MLIFTRTSLNPGLSDEIFHTSSVPDLPIGCIEQYNAAAVLLTNWTPPPPFFLLLFCFFFCRFLLKEAHFQINDEAQTKPDQDIRWRRFQEESGLSVFQEWTRRRGTKGYPSVTLFSCILSTICSVCVLWLCGLINLHLAAIQSAQGCSFSKRTTIRNKTHGLWFMVLPTRCSYVFAGKATVFLVCVCVLLMCLGPSSLG